MKWFINLAYIAEQMCESKKFGLTRFFVLLQPLTPVSYFILLQLLKVLNIYKPL